MKLLSTDQVSIMLDAIEFHLKIAKAYSEKGFNATNEIDNALIFTRKQIEKLESMAIADLETMFKPVEK